VEEGRDAAPARLWPRELGKLVAALVIFALLGGVLILVLRDDREQNTIQPGQPAPLATTSPAASATVVAAPTVTLVPSPRPTRTPSPVPTPTAVLPVLGEVVAEIGVSARPFALLEAEGSIWVQSPSTVERIDPANNQVIAQIEVTPVGGPGSTYKLGGMTSGGGSIWVANSLEPEVVQIDPATNQAVAFSVTGEALSGSGFDELLYADDSLWTVDYNAQPSLVLRIDPVSHAVVATFPVTVAFDAGFHFGSIWVTGEGTVWRIDPATNQIVAEVAVDGTSIEMAFTSDALWVTSGNRHFVTRIDPATNKVVATVQLGFVSGTLTADAESVWVGGPAISSTGAELNEGLVARVDPTTNALSHRVSTPGWDQILVAADGDLWLSSERGDGKVVRIRPSP
jgi:hypothetical protein